jgi:5-dehydro-2-deoxygluconokinase
MKSEINSEKDSKRKSAWEIDDKRPIDVICMGRVAVDLYAEQIGASLEDAQTFRKYLGGCAGNIAVGSARAGLRSAMFSCIGSDAMGQFLKQELQRESVDITLLKENSQHLTGLVLLGINPPERFPLIFYRENCADMQLRKDDVSSEFISQAKSLLITGTGLSTEAMRVTTHHAAETARSAKTKVIFDLDYRPVLWGLTQQGDGETRYKTSPEVSLHYQDMLAACDLIVGTEEEILIAGNASDLEQALAVIRGFTACPLVVKRGSQGCSIYFDDLTQPLNSPPFPVAILNVLGAGDAFMSGLLRGLLRAQAWEVCAQYANASGAIVVTRHGCAPAMPYFEEITSLINERECLIKDNA